MDTSMSDDKIEVNKEEYEVLKRRDELLTYMEYLGVEITPIYNEALDMYADGN